MNLSNTIDTARVEQSRTLMNRMKLIQISLWVLEVKENVMRNIKCKKQQGEVENR